MATKKTAPAPSSESELTEAGLRLQVATLEVNLEKAEAAYRAKPTPATDAAWQQAQAELRASRVFWRGIREFLAAAPAPSKES